MSNWRGNDFDGQGSGNTYYSRRDRRESDNQSSRNRNNRQHGDNNFASNDQNGLVIYINSSKVGKVVGKGGSKIRELQDISQASIQIDRNKCDDGNTAITITGETEAQERAKQLIEKLVGDDRYSNQRDTENNYATHNHTKSNYSTYSDNHYQTSGERNEECNWSANATPCDVAAFDWNIAAKQYDEYKTKLWSTKGPIKKEFYFEDPTIASMSEEDVAKFRRENNKIEVKLVFDQEQDASANVKIPNPIQTFDQAFSHYPDIMEEIRKQGFEKPSPIQCQSWPILLSGKDMIGIAQTGTGKTLAFLLPALIHIDGQETSRSEQTGPNVLIMAPTRELALQIEKEVGKYKYRGIKAVCVYGGGSRKDQISIVERGVEIVIATPGRLNDLVQAKVLDVTCVTYLVLDEADRMLDMGFEPQIRKTLIDVRPDRQTVMTSATWPQGVRRLAQSYMKDPIQVFVGSLDLAAVHTVTQKIFMVDEEEKTEMLESFFSEMGPDDKVIVFFGKKCRVDELSSELALKGVNCQSIHGGRDQSDREQALADIKSSYVRILLATDVASRGIDIEDITHVFNYDFPHDIEEYVHRVGRTGRAGRTGESISLMTRKDWSHAKGLISILEEASQEVPEELYKMAERYEHWKEKKAQEKDDARSYGRGPPRRSRYDNDRF
ncbi:probable ATP-dependent RNA helicase DDX43 [Prorops nasuta]|uniref:probable ATP-dependent RNA helicase DDX43 n=1 Tax=Prorops nasuta TaxID=863751 RepID=UPI0034CE935E